MQQFDWPRMVAMGLMYIATAINVGALLYRYLRKDKVNWDMETAMDKYIHDPTPDTVFALWLMEHYPDGNCELGQTLTDYAKWKEDREIGTPLRLLNDGFVVEAIMRGVKKNPPEES